jgi:dipeptidyl aminopeptidase/acylaminoacyl peptidase
VLSLPKGTLSLGPGPLSADGKTIAREGFDDKHPGSAGIYLTRASDGKILRRVTRAHFIPGDFSPDGKQLVLFKGAEGDPPAPGSLWLVNTRGTGLRRLTPVNVQVGCCFNYRWSPDGTKILFADSNGVLWTIAPNGSKLTQVFKDVNGRLRGHAHVVTRRLDDHVRARSGGEPVHPPDQRPLRDTHRRERSRRGHRREQLQGRARLGKRLTPSLGILRQQRPALGECSRMTPDEKRLVV